MQVPVGVPFVLDAADGNAAAVYSLMACPPFDPGASHVTVAVVPLNVAATPEGAPGATTATGEVTDVDNAL